MTFEAMILPALTLMATGAFAGVLAGLLGVGGGVVLVPAYLYVFTQAGFGGPDVMQICLATSLATIIVTSIRSVMAHNKRGAVDWEILRGWAPGIAVGALIGVLTVSALRSQVLQIIFGVLVIIIASYMAFSRANWRLDDEMPTGIRRAVISPFVGFFSVLLGIGGGSIGVPLMTLHGRPNSSGGGDGGGIWRADRHSFGRDVPVHAGDECTADDGRVGEPAGLCADHRDDDLYRADWRGAGAPDRSAAAKAVFRDLPDADRAEHDPQDIVLRVLRPAPITNAKRPPSGGRFHSQGRRPVKSGCQSPDAWRR